MKNMPDLVRDFIHNLHPNHKMEVLQTLSILYQGWECDEWAWIVSVDDEKKLIMTNHGSPYVGDPLELDQKMSEYLEALAETQKALLTLAT